MRDGLRQSRLIAATAGLKTRTRGGSHIFPGDVEQRVAEIEGSHAGYRRARLGRRERIRAGDRHLNAGGGGEHHRRPRCFDRDTGSDELPAESLRGAAINANWDGNNIPVPLSMTICGSAGGCPYFQRGTSRA